HDEIGRGLREGGAEHERGGGAQYRAPCNRAHANRHDRSPAKSLTNPFLVENASNLKGLRHKRAPQIGNLARARAVALRGSILVSDNVEPLSLRVRRELSGRERSGEKVAAASGEPGQRGFRLAGGERSERFVDGGLPLFVGDSPRRILGRDDADVVLGERDVDERAASRAVDPTQDELRERRSMAAERTTRLGTIQRLTGGSETKTATRMAT